MREAWRKWHESALLGALLAACLILGFLQYRWTGELSRAEAARLSAGTQGRLQELARAFDAVLRRDVLALVPAGDAVAQLGAQQANAEVLRRALADPDRRPLFRRIAAAVRGPDDQLEFFEANQAEARFEASPWPAEEAWQKLRSRLEQIARGGDRRGPIIDPNSALIELPVFANGAEAEWMLFEVDLRYLTEQWLPQLVRTYLNPDGEAAFHVAVAPASNPSRIVWQDPPNARLTSADAEASLFPARFLGPGRPGPGRWQIVARHPLGSVPAAVAAASRRNLLVGLVLLGLIMAAGVALLRNTRQARRLAAAQYQFFAGISHELRTPLTVIQGAGHNLLSGVVKDEAQRESYLRAIVKQSGALTEMVEQLLAFGAIGKQQPAGQAALEVVVSEAIEEAAMELEHSGRSVDVDMPADLPPVAGDGVWLRRVFVNLILNAIRHGDGEIRISAALSETRVEVRVADGGAGIPPEQLKQVFEPFFRGERARTGRARGTGLGLSLVKETVQKMGGSVAAESEPGQGAVFIVRLPVIV